MGEGWTDNPEPKGVYRYADLLEKRSQLLTFPKTTEPAFSWGALQKADSPEEAWVTPAILRLTISRMTNDVYAAGPTTLQVARRD